MILKEKLPDNPGFQFVTDSLNIISALGRRRLLQQTWMNDATQLTEEWNRIDVVMQLLQNPSHQQSVTDLRHRLMELHDPQGTLRSIQQHTTLDEVDLFETKLFAFLSNALRRCTQALGIDHLISLPDLTPVFQLLDPDGTNIPHFYIYDSYDARLTPIRKQLKSNTIDDSLRAALLAEQNEIQQQVVHHLAEQLWPWADTLVDAIQRVAYLDLLFAKADLFLQWGLCKPTLSAQQIHYQGLFNPRLLQRKVKLGLRYQPVDIDLQPGVCFITGANMAGKTVLLKSVGVAQLMAQFGFFLPAKEAQVVLVEDVASCIGDEQNEMNGLSSFASEILKISDTVQRCRQQRLLVLIDEPARTTNPIEGKAIVQAIATILESKDSTTLITTHYSQLGLPCRKLRVKGFVEDLSDRPLTPDTINQFMDYSLLEDSSDEVPQEALRIARILNCDEEILTRAAQAAQ